MVNRWSLLFGLVAFGASAALHAGVFMRIGALQGDCTEKNHKDWLQLQSFSWGPIQQEAYRDGGGAAGGMRLRVGAINFTKTVDRASVKLLEALTRGTSFPEARVEYWSPTATHAHFVLTVRNAVLTSFEMGAASSTQVLSETCTLSYAEGTLETWTQKPDGTSEPAGSYWLSKVAGTGGLASASSPAPAVDPAAAIAPVAPAAPAAPGAPAEPLAPAAFKPMRATSFRNLIPIVRQKTGP